MIGTMPRNVLMGIGFAAVLAIAAATIYLLTTEEPAKTDAGAGSRVTVDGNSITIQEDSGTVSGNVLEQD